MKKIPLTQGYFAIVDDADFERVSAHKWCAYKRDKEGRLIHAARGIPREGGGRTTQYLHQFLMPGVAEIDHRDGDGLNNCRHNLRPATRRQNLQGFQKKRLGATSRFRGVCWESWTSRWLAQIKVDGRPVKLGRFSSEEDAARAYDAAALSRDPNFHHLNFS